MRILLIVVFSLVFGGVYAESNTIPERNYVPHLHSSNIDYGVFMQLQDTKSLTYWEKLIVSAAIHNQKIYLDDFFKLYKEFDFSFHLSLVFSAGLKLNKLSMDEIEEKKDLVHEALYYFIYGKRNDGSFTAYYDWKLFQSVKLKKLKVKVDLFEMQLWSSKYLNQDTIRKFLEVSKRRRYIDEVLFVSFAVEMGIVDERNYFSLSQSPLSEGGLSYERLREVMLADGVGLFDASNYPALEKIGRGFYFDHEDSMHLTSFVSELPEDKAEVFLLHYILLRTGMFKHRNAIYSDERKALEHDEAILRVFDEYLKQPECKSKNECN